MLTSSRSHLHPRTKHWLVPLRGIHLLLHILQHLRFREASLLPTLRLLLRLLMSILTMYVFSILKLHHSY